MNRTLKTGDLVLCKVGSFPPWPAVVYPQPLLRSDVYRKKKQNCIAVCFFNDPTYYWEQPHRLNKLDSKIIDEYLSREEPEHNQPELLEAYQQAKDFTTLHEFIVGRYKEERRETDLEQILSLGEIKSGEDPSMAKVNDNSAKRRGRDGGSGRVSHSTDSRNGQRGLSEGETGKKKIKSEPSATESNIESRDGAKNGNGNNNRTLKRNGTIRQVEEKTNEKRTKLDRTRRAEISLLFRRRIQKNLVQRDEPPSDSELEESHNMLNKIQQNLANEPPFFDLEALRESKLHKLFKVIVNDSNLEQFHAVCKTALLEWKDIIAELKFEKLKNEQDNI